MSKLEGTKTLENLMKAFAGESQARNRYTYFASIARKEGYHQIEAISWKPPTTKKNMPKFSTSMSWLAWTLESAVPVDISATYPAGLGDTHKNLLSAAAGEHEEWTELYNHLQMSRHKKASKTLQPASARSLMLKRA